MRLFDTDTSVRDIGGNGVVAAPPNPATPNGLKVTVRLIRDTIEHTTCGVVATVFGLPNTAAFASNCGTPSSPGNIAAGAQITSIDTQISGSSGFGVLSNGPGANNDMAGHVVTGNDTGLGVLNGGTIALVAAGNDLFDNTHNGAPTSSVALTQGPAGATGATGGSGADGGGGDKGSPGQQGATGKTGPSGPAGQVRIVSCHQTPSGQKCSATLESSPVKVTADRAVTRVVLARAGRVSARGTLRRSHLALTSSRRLVAGRYVMTIWRHGRLAGRINVVLGVSHA
jgi:hypothetical protein